MNTVKVAVTGAAGQIGYALYLGLHPDPFWSRYQGRVAALELEPALPALEGVKMELDDCAFPLLQKSPPPPMQVSHSKIQIGFCWLAQHQEKQGWSATTSFVSTEVYLSDRAKPSRNKPEIGQNLVIGNPCNTNCMIAMSHAPSIPKNRWFAMTALDENRARRQLAERSGSDISDVKSLHLGQP